jgi:hypothetical protein
MPSHNAQYLQGNPKPVATILLSHEKKPDLSGKYFLFETDNQEGGPRFSFQGGLPKFIEDMDI